MTRVIALFLVLAGCATTSPGAAAAPDDGFLAAVRAVMAELEREGAGAHPVRVDPRAIGREALSVSGGGLVEAPEVSAARAAALGRVGFEPGDVALAEECAHVGGMGGVMPEPLTLEQRRLIEHCRDAFGGFTLGVSLPRREAGGIVVYRVLAFGSDTELGWDVTLDPRGEVTGVRKVMDHVS